MITNPSSSNPVSYLRTEYERQQALFSAQPTIVQRFIEGQAQRLANALINQEHQVSFMLPDQVVSKMQRTSQAATMLIPVKLREHTAGSWGMHFRQPLLREALRQKLNELEKSPDQAISTGASLIRYAMAIHMVYQMLPSGRSVTYCADGDEQTPTIPIKNDETAGSAITSTTEAIVEQEPNEEGRGELLVPFVPAARRFYIPQWVAFDEDGRLFAHSVGEAEAHLASMQRFIDILHTASSFAPYMVADEEYQRKRYGMLGQLINQGRSLACYKTEQIIQAILERLRQGTLNRGLSITLPYFDDQELGMDKVELEVIPAGRISFKPIFAVRAAQLEHAKVSQDTRLNTSTRKYLLRELERLEQFFFHFPTQAR